MKKNMRGVIDMGIGSIVGLSMGGAVGNAAEGAATSTGMSAGGAALARTTPTLYMGGLLGSIKRKRK